ncbi:MAG: hypothetical protein Q8L56_09045 [Rhodocyclaceae bacterium]|nr:hypothetical protein [Rhodocyclaceae bacterium]
MKKTLLVGVAILVIALGGVAFWLVSSLDSLVKTAIEKYGSEITQVSVSVGNVKISPTDGKGAIEGLRVGNPKGFRTPHAMSVGSIELAVDPASLASDVVLIRRIAIASPRISYEAGSGDKSNFDVIQRNVDQSLGKHRKEKASQGKKMIVDHLSIRDIKVNYSPFLLEGQGFEISLPDIELRDIGKSKGGVTSGELAKVVMDTLMTRMTRAITDSLKGVADVTKSVTDSVKGLFK